MYLNGINVDKNVNEALVWFEKSALNGIKISYKAIGDIYLKGNGVKQDFKEAFKWYLEF